jgi:hypothetical protein
MAINWIASLKDVPWTKVIGMAPTIAESGRKLWDKVSSRTGGDRPGETTQSAAQLPVPAAIAAFELRLEALELKSAQLREEAVASFDVVRAITDQHSQVVHAVDVLLVRTRLLVRTSVLLGIACVALFALVLSR